MAHAVAYIYHRGRGNLILRRSEWGFNIRRLRVQMACLRGHPESEAQYKAAMPPRLKHCDGHVRVHSITGLKPQLHSFHSFPAHSSHRSTELLTFSAASPKVPKK